jgi:hypothetical protein
MALSNYTELKAALANWINRRDLTASIPDFITLAEADMRSDVRSDTVREPEFVLDAESTELPADCAELRSLSITSPVGYRPPRFVSKMVFDEERARQAGATGAPRFATIVGRELLVTPAPDQAYTAELTYFENFPKLSADQASNSVLRDAENVYLYGALRHAIPFLKDDARVQTIQPFYDAAVAQLNKLRERREHPTGSRARLPVVFG